MARRSQYPTATRGKGPLENTMKRIALAVLMTLTFAPSAHASPEGESAREIRLLRAQSKRLQKQLERDVRLMAKTAPKLERDSTASKQP